MVHYYHRAVYLWYGIFAFVRRIIFGGTARRLDYDLLVVQMKTSIRNERHYQTRQQQPP